MGLGYKLKIMRRRSRGEWMALPSSSRRASAARYEIFVSFTLKFHIPRLVPVDDRPILLLPSPTGSVPANTQELRTKEQKCCLKVLEPKKVTNSNEKSDMRSAGKIARPSCAEPGARANMPLDDALAPL
jgi:hypothetical protein